MDLELARRLEELKQKQLYRKLRPLASSQGPRVNLDGREILNFSSNDYLGLAAHPALAAAAHEAAAKWGSGSGASRLVCGSLNLYHELEQSLAAFKGADAALLFSTGYAAALGAITSLASPADFVVIDKLVHASIVDAARLSGATLRVFRHNNPADLERILGWCRGQKADSPRQILIITESVYSMDGDFAPLRELAALKDRYHAWLMVDEAHATGLFGPGRSGLIEELGLRGRVEIQMATLGKALGSSGGFITGSRVLADYLVNRARSFIFSTAPSPASAAAALAALRLIQSSEGDARLETLRSHLQFLRDSLSALQSAPPHSPILPLLIGSEENALALSQKLLDAGFLIPAIRYPTVPRNQARLRLTASAAHTPEDLHRLIATLKPLL